MKAAPAARFPNPTAKFLTCVGYCCAVKIVIMAFAAPIKHLAVMERCLEFLFQVCQLKCFLPIIPKITTFDVATKLVAKQTTPAINM